MMSVPVPYTRYYFELNGRFFPEYLGSIFFSSGRGSFPVLPAAGGRREAASTVRRKCEPCPRSVARALGLRNRELWQETTGNHSDLLEPSRIMETPQF